MVFQSEASDLVASDDNGSSISALAVGTPQATQSGPREHGQRHDGHHAHGERSQFRRHADLLDHRRQHRQRLHHRSEHRRDTVNDASQLDFETTPSFTLDVRVTDQTGLHDDDTVEITLTDVNDAPILGNVGGSVSAIGGGAAVLLDLGSDARVLDVDSPDFDGGTLTVTIATNAVVGEDLLGVDQSGAVSLGGTSPGSNVLVNGVVVGTLANSVAVGNDFVVNLNGDATLVRVETLIRALTYQNTETDADNTARTVGISVTDGPIGSGGATSNVSEVTVTVDDGDPSGAAGFVVTTTDDVVANDGLISLREAIANANANAGVDTITFDATVFNDASDIIRIDSELTITDSVVIQGATFDPTDATGLSRITISGDSLADGGLIGAGDADGFGDTNLFRVTSGSADVAFQDLVLRDGSSTFQAGAINAELGHDVTLENVTVTENRGGAGGGIRATGGFFTLRNGIVSDNTSINANVGGGILANDFSVINSTISGNTANQGGGIYTVGDGTIVNTTISGNTATNAGGGGIFASTGAEVRITNSTITQNSATGGGGILAANGTFYLANTVIAQNTATGNSARDDVGTFGAGWCIASATISSVKPARLPALLS